MCMSANRFRCRDSTDVLMSATMPRVSAPSMCGASIRRTLIAVRARGHGPLTARGDEVVVESDRARWRSDHDRVDDAAGTRSRNALARWPRPLAGSASAAHCAGFGSTARIGLRGPRSPGCGRAGNAAGHLIARRQLATDPLDVGGVDAGAMPTGDPTVRRGAGGRAHMRHQRAGNPATAACR